MLTPRGVREKAVITRHFLARKKAKYAALVAEIEELQKELEGEKTGQG